MRFEKILGACIGIFMILNVKVNNATVFRFTNVVCESHNKSWVIWQNCRLKAVSRSKVILNMNATVVYPANSVKIHFKLFKKANGLKPWLMDRNIDACRFIKTRYDPIMKMVYGLFKDFTNVNHSCPYVGSQIVEGFYLRPEVMGLPFPTGDYMLALRWYFGMSTSPTADTNVSFSFIEDLLKRT
ncbi:uncharacterized protein LOC117585204 [Drosophila guanche]|uniref:uncharacterized protein LOC117585204 n=1 Tax=Drosophila guanche TaxID=7266 RepID=UPI0014717A61|nr:uncharacterized protein LOC117585204 [Drosophila guanche]